MTSLNNPDFMAFPFRIGAEGAALHDRLQHVRAVIEQVLFTHPGERWYRPDFGVGARCGRVMSACQRWAKLARAAAALSYTSNSL